MVQYRGAAHAQDDAVPGRLGDRSPQPWSAPAWWRAGPHVRGQREDRPQGGLRCEEAIVLLSSCLFLPPPFPYAYPPPCPCGTSVVSIMLFFVPSAQVVLFAFSPSGILLPSARLCRSGALASAQVGSGLGRSGIVAPCCLLRVCSAATILFKE